MMVFSKYHISKFNILLRQKDEPTNIFVYQVVDIENLKGFYAQADLELLEGKDFKRL